MQRLTDCLSAKLVTVTPDDAHRLMEFNTHSGQRTIKDWRRRVVEDALRSGEFRTGNIALIVFPDGETVLINGQHTLAAIIRTMIPARVVMEEWHLDSKDASSVERIWSMYDKGRDVRTMAELCQNVAKTYNVEFTPSDLTKVVSGLAWQEYGSLNATNTNDRAERARLLAKYPREVAFVRSIFSPGDTSNRIKTPDHVKRSSVVSAMVRTFRSNESMARSFWLKVAVGDQLALNSPEYKLHFYLIENKAGRHHQRGKPSQQEYQYEACLQAWNAYLAGKTTLMFSFAALEKKYAKKQRAA